MITITVKDGNGQVILKAKRKDLKQAHKISSKYKEEGYFIQIKSDKREK